MQRFSLLRSISESLAVASSLSSLLTLLIALELFNKFGIEQEILQKNLEFVSKVFGLLAKIEISANVDGSFHFIRLSRDLREGLVQRFNNKYGEMIVAGDISVMSGLRELLDIGESIYMPREIASCIRKFNFSSINYAEDIVKSKDKYIFLQFIGASKKVFSMELNKYIDDNRVGLLDDKEMKLKDYLQTFDDLYKSCNKWLKNNSSINLDLNS
jgi:hypothetical protein